MALLDRGTIQRSLGQFAGRWAENIDGWSPEQRATSERRYAQTFWADLLRCFGVIPERLSLFEHDARRASTGSTGRADVFWSNVFIGEAKSLGRDLEAAEYQALDYLSGGSIGPQEWPKHVLSSDFARFRLSKLGEDAWTVTFPVQDLTDHLDQLMFLAGRESVTPREQEEASIQASRVMANLYTAILGDDADEQVGDAAPQEASEEEERVQRVSVLLTRLLFLLYGDDAGLWEEDLFYRFVLHDTTADNLGPQLAGLFGVLGTQHRRHVPTAMSKFPYVNGSLFDGTGQTEFFTPEMREALLEACRFRWTRISPAVFGSMFQMVKSQDARRATGEHYTTETNILKTLGPLFLDQMQAEADRLCRNTSTTERDLRAFQDRLASHVFVDPACGSGNFLTVAYGRIRDIETQIIAEVYRRSGTSNIAWDTTLDTKVTIDQFHGFEISWWPAKIAETAMFLVDHQANRKLAEIGEPPHRLPITVTAHIQHTNALAVDWAALLPTAGGMTYVFGNPPFLGHETRTRAQAAELRTAWGSADIGRLDYVTGWHKKTLDLLEHRPGEFAYVTTNSITQGDQVPRLFGPIQDAGWVIKFAHRTFAWTSEAPGRAAVHCVIVGFTRDTSSRPRLWEYDTPRATGALLAGTTQINAYLVAAPPVLVATRRDPISPIVQPATFGNMPRDNGGLVVELADLEEVRADPVAAKYLRRYVGSRELIRGLQRWCLWLVDLDPADLPRSDVLRRRLRQVRDYRLASTAESTRAMADTPHLFGQRSQPHQPYVCIPRVFSEGRRYMTTAHFDPDVIVSDAAFRVIDPDGLQFGVISSSMFLVWQHTIGGRLESRPRFANTLTWNTFPVPDLTSGQRTAISTAGRNVLQARAQHPERTLADAYHPLGMDPALLSAHHALDQQLDKAFGATRRLTTQRQRQELLFASYATLTGVPAV